MATAGLDDDGDLAQQNGRLVHVSGRTEIGQRVFIRLQRFLGEWFEDRALGVPYFEYIIGHRNVDTRLATSIIAQHIAGTRGVIQVETLSFDLHQNRTFTVRYSFTAEGEAAPITGVFTPLLVSETIVIGQTSGTTDVALQRGQIAYRKNDGHLGLFDGTLAACEGLRAGGMALLNYAAGVEATLVTVGGVAQGYTSLTTGETYFAGNDGWPCLEGDLVTDDYSASVGGSEPSNKIRVAFGDTFKVP